MSWQEKFVFNIIVFQQSNLITRAIIVVNVTILTLIILSLGIFVAETYSLPTEVLFWLRQLDTFILVIFSFEYFIRFYVAPSKVNFFFNFNSLIDFISILPLFLGFFDVRFIRVFRCFRFLRFFRFFEFKISILKIEREDVIIYARILLTLFSIIFVYSGLIYQVEHSINKKVFQNFGDALYFCIVTMTTVGFGDVTPISDLGKLLTVSMILTGVALIPWQLGDLIKQLLKTSNQDKKLCPSCSLALHEADANYCKICGVKLMAR